MDDRKAPYFLWDYDLTEADVRSILRWDNRDDKAWLVARLLESARFEDVWKYITLAELYEIFPQLQLKPQVRRVWEFALQVWSSEQVDGR